MDIKNNLISPNDHINSGLKRGKDFEEETANKRFKPSFAESAIENFSDGHTPFSTDRSNTSTQTVSQSVFETSYFSFDLKQAIRQEKISQIISYLNQLFQNKDRCPFAQNSTLSTDNIHDILELSITRPSTALFSGIIQMITPLFASFFMTPVFTEKMRRAFYKEICADVHFTIISKNKNWMHPPTHVNVNQAYLKNFSPLFNFDPRYFKGKIYSHPSKPYSVELIIEDFKGYHPDLTPEHFYEILRYCYTGSISFGSIKECLAIFTFASKCKIDSLANFCDDWLSDADFCDLTEEESIAEVEEWLEKYSLPKYHSCLMSSALTQYLKGDIPLAEEVISLLIRNQTRLKKLSLPFPLTSDQLQFITTTFLNIESIAFYELKNDDLNNYSLFLRNLTKLTSLECVNSELSSEFIAFITSTQLPFLTSLSLINCKFNHPKLMIKNPSLHSLKITENFQQFSELTPQNNQLKSLTLNIETCSKSTLEEFVKFFPNLTLLNLDIGIFKELDTYDEVIKKFNHLKELKLAFKHPYEFFDSNIENFDAVYDEFIEKINKLKSITEIFLDTFIVRRSNSLSLSPMPLIHTCKWDGNDDGIINRPFLENLINIETLDLTSVTLDDGEGLFEQLKTFPYLHTLHFNTISILKDAHLAKLPDIRSLEHLSFSFCDEITDEGIGYLSKSQALQELTLIKCGNISKESVFALSRKLKHVNIKLTSMEIKDYDSNTSDIEDRLMNILTINPFNLPLLSYLAMSNNPDQLDYAQSTLEIATQKKPEELIYWMLLKHVYGRLNEQKKAHDPDTYITELLPSKALSLEELKNKFEKKTEKFPHEPMYWQMLSDVYSQLNQTEESKTASEHAKRLIHDREKIEVPFVYD